MISNEQYEEFYNTIDSCIIELKNQQIFDNSKTNIEWHVNLFTKTKYNKEYPIVWVKQNNTPIKEFYPSEYQLSWLVTYIHFHRSFLNDGHGQIEKDLTDTLLCCVCLFLTLINVNGINIVNETVYLLEKDCQFVEYNVSKKLFI